MHGNKRDAAQLPAQADALGITLDESYYESQNYALWPEHADAVELFVRCMTQWRAGSNGVIGLDYGVVMQLASLYQISNPAKALEELQIMELHARDLINSQAGDS